MNQSNIIQFRLKARPAFEPAPAPIVFDRDLPPPVLAAIVGMRDYTLDSVPFFVKGETSTELPCLRLRESDSPGSLGYWTIEDRLDPRAMAALDRTSPRLREGTGFGQLQRRQAAKAFLAYVTDKRDRLLALVRPDEIPLVAVFENYRQHLESPARNRNQGTADSYLAKLVPVVEFWGALRIGDVTKKMGERFETWRRQQIDWRDGTLISYTEINLELSVLRQSINHFLDGTPMHINIRYYLPRRDTPAFKWLTRDEAARYLWACRGRIAVEIKDAVNKVVGHRWLIARDADPTLTGPEGDRRVLRSRREIAKRKMEARRFLLGVYTGSRHRVLIDTAYAGACAQAYMSHVEGAFHRRPQGPGGASHKRRPSIPVVPKLGRFMWNWAISDAVPQPGRQCPTTVVHQENGAPYVKGFNAGMIARVAADACMTKPLNSHTLRHTTALWLKIEGVSMMVAANFLGVTVENLVKHYDQWDELSMYEAIDALTAGTKQKEALKRQRTLNVA